jgi:hypothetical protein
MGRAKNFAERSLSLRQRKKIQAVLRSGSWLAREVEITNCDFDSVSGIEAGEALPFLSRTGGEVFEVLICEDRFPNFFA